MWRRNLSQRAKRDDEGSFHAFLYAFELLHCLSVMRFMPHVRRVFPFLHMPSFALETEEIVEF